MHPLASLLGGVGSVEDANNTALAEPAEHISNGGLSGETSSSLALGIVRVEEFGGRVRRFGGSCRR